MTDEILTKIKKRKSEKRGAKPYNEIGKEMRKVQKNSGIMRTTKKMRD